MNIALLKEILAKSANKTKQRKFYFDFLTFAPNIMRKEIGKISDKINRRKNAKKSFGGVQKMEGKTHWNFNAVRKNEMQVVLKQNQISEAFSRRNNKELGKKIGIIGKLFGCWHKDLSRPFSNKKSSYRTCLHCGARKHFDANNLKTFGPFYYPPVVQPEKA